jgi:hypothetical protein
MLDARRVREYYPGAFDLSRSISARLEIDAFVTARLDEIMLRAHTPVEPSHLGELPIFVYWAQGADAAPAVVRACIAQLRASNPEATIHVLDDTLIGEYLDIPPGVRDKLWSDKTHLSDYLRLALLERYGGIWVDATCYVTGDLQLAVEPLLGQGVFYFRWFGDQISSWFIAARRENYMVRVHLAALTMWFEEHDEIPDYFVMHRIFEALCRIDGRFGAMWDAVPRLSTLPPHRLQLTMFRSVDDDTLRDILEHSFVHKLRYKYDPARVKATSVLARLTTEAEEDAPPETTEVA